MKIKIVRRKQLELEKEVDILSEMVKVDLGSLSEDKWVVLYKKWRSFLTSLSDEQKRQIKVWACPTVCTPVEIDRIVKATKGSLEKASK